MKKFLAAIALVLGASHAHAGFMIEPYLGYEMGESEYGSGESDYTGTYFGARVGYESLGFMFGLDYMTGAGELEDNEGDTSDLDPTDIGVYAGFEFPVLIRAYATYFVSSKGKPANGDDYKGGGYKIGVGFTGLPFIAINLEMIHRTYDENTGGIDLDVNTWGLNVSLPLP